MVLAMVTESRLGLTKAILEYWIDKEVSWWFVKLLDSLICTATDRSLELSNDKMNESVMMLN